MVIIPLIALTLSVTSVLAPGFCLSELTNQGSRDLAEILYAYTSATGTNGSAFAGLNANTRRYNITLGIAMLFAGCFLMIVSLPTSVILIGAAVKFGSALSLGPVLQDLMMQARRAF